MSYIIIYFQMVSKHIKGQGQQAKVVIKDGYSLLTYTDEKQTKATYEAMKKDGKKCDMKEGMIVEYYPDKTCHQIKDLVEIDIANLKNKYSKFMDVTHSVNFVK